jgi:hypothetical protein
MNSFRCSAGEGKTALYADVSFVGNDICVRIYGGQAHIGSIAIGIPRPGLAGSSSGSSTTSVFNLDRHKDEQLTYSLARKLSAKTVQTVVVMGGFHIDSISNAEIEEVLTNYEMIEKTILTYFA